MFFPASGVEVSPWVLIGIGLSVGICGGFFGIGGSAIVTPALNLLGFRMPYAIGTDFAHIFGKSTAAVLKHKRLGNVDMKAALLLMVGTLPGVEMGKQLVMHLDMAGKADVVVRWIQIAVLISISAFMLWECATLAIRNGRNGIHKGAHVAFSARSLQRLRLSPLISLPVSQIEAISVWVIIGAGLFTGFLAGIFGGGGGFVRVPVMIYVLGMPTSVAVGTDLFEVLVTGGFGTLTYALAGRVDFLAALFMLLGGATGAQIGALATAYVSGVRLRFLFALTILTAAIAVLLKQMSSLLDVVLYSQVATILLLSAAAIMSAIIVLSLLVALKSKQQAEVRL